MTPTAPAEPRAGFRADLEGLRAVAALLVAVYHIWLGRVSGGVDVFFVIAGFLVTGSLLRQVHRTGRVSPGRFFGRLLVRLLPNALTVLLSVLVAATVLLPVTRRADTLREVVGSALYVENWLLISDSVDYLARDRGDSLLQHFWALSIQGQFYVLWLVIAVLAVAVGARRAVRRRLALLVLLVTLASFAASVVLTHLNQPVAYFHTAARAWEFGVGGLVALGLARIPTLTRGVHTLLGWVGLGLVVTTGLLLPVASAFPGVAALVPVAGATLILLSGQGGRGSATRLLASRPLVSLGGVAYAIYLWHWPLLVLSLHLRGVDRAGAWDGALVLGTSVLLAYASTHLVERPVRQVRWSQRPSWVAPLAGAGAILLTVGAASTVNAVTAPATLSASGEGGPLAHWSQAQSRPDFDAPAGESPAPGYAAAVRDLSQAHLDKCQQHHGSAEVIRCTYGDPDADRTMVLVGGSQATHWQPALDQIADRTGWRLEVMVKGECRQGMHLVDPEHDYLKDDRKAERCREWNASVLELLTTERPELVVGSTTVVTQEGETLPVYYDAFWRELAEHDLEMLGIRGTPRATVNRLDCIVEHGPEAPECDVRRAATLAEVNPAAVLDEELPGLTVADLSDWLCTPTSCPPVIEDTIVYHDGGHLTATFARALATPLYREVTEVFSR
ncbi:acyltransferase family protein [Ornithinimicrobium pekingense]|uniref:Acyltransferase n=1 Tax=Ornithinimicrobium pekingense TaxID=384677 RepID=A0ABQ2F421_9MICO|nr:acyltransferase family protein [Ornithinimicrobium pekingense]GGK57681.1 acyltransferase [Ornithinimicrobium pekingense]